MPITHMALDWSTASLSSILAATGSWQGRIVSEAAPGKYQGLPRMVAAQISPATFSCFTLSVSPDCLLTRCWQAGSRSVLRLVPSVKQMFWDLSGLVCTWLWQGFGCLAGFRPPFLGCD